MYCRFTQILGPPCPLDGTTIPLFAAPNACFMFPLSQLSQFRSPPIPIGTGVCIFGTDCSTNFPSVYWFSYANVLVPCVGINTCSLFDGAYTCEPYSQHTNPINLLEFDFGGYTGCRFRIDVTQ